MAKRSADKARLLVVAVPDRAALDLARVNALVNPALPLPVKVAADRAAQRAARSVAVVPVTRR